jgi:hypothetical protein
METLIFSLCFIIGALGTAFVLYYLRTRKLLKTQHELLMESSTLVAVLAKELAKAKDGDTSEPAPEKPCDSKAKAKSK